MTTDQFHGEHQRCPHCQEPISLEQAATIIHGDGAKKFLKARAKG